MKIDTFVYKLIDHDNKCVQKICIKIICKHKPEWDQVDMIHQEYHTMSPAHRSWLNKDAEWKHAVRETVANIVKKNYPHIKDFVLEKVEDRSECHKVNMSHTKGTNGAEMHMMKIFGMEKCMMAYAKGKCPEPWTEMFRYDGTYHEHVFEANLGSQSDVNDPLLTIKPNGEIAILTPLACYGTKKVIELGAPIQKGGQDADMYKYLKYKKKYNEMKKKQW